MLCLAAAVVWLLKDRARILAELREERTRRESLHENLHRVRATYAQTLLGLAHRLEQRIRSRQS